MAVFSMFLTFFGAVFFVMTHIYGQTKYILQKNCPHISFPCCREAPNILHPLLKRPHRLLNWQIQVTRVSWVGQSTNLKRDNTETSFHVWTRYCIYSMNIKVGCKKMKCIFGIYGSREGCGGRHNTFTQLILSTALEYLTNLARRLLWNWQVEYSVHSQK